MNSRAQRLREFGFGCTSQGLATTFGVLLCLAPFAGEAMAQGREPPARNLVCTGCVGTDDLANGSVTKSKLAAGLLDGLTPTIPNNSITGAKLKNGIISTTKIKDAAVSSEKILDGAVVKGKIGRGAIFTSNLKNKAVTTLKIRDGAVTNAKIAPDAVDGPRIVDGSVGSNDISPDAINASHIGPNAVGSSEIADNAVGSSEISNNAVNAQHIATDAVGADEIAPNSVGASELQSNAIGALQLGPNSVGTSEIADNGVGSTELQDFVTMGTPNTNGLINIITAKTDRTAVQLFSNGAGGGYIQTSGVTNNPSVRLNTFSDGAGYFEVMDKSGTTVAGINGSNGNVFGKTKSFLVDDPTDDNRMIKYTSIEGAEAAIYARGTAQLDDGWTLIDLPAHFTALVDPESMSVTLTPRAASSLGLAAVDVQADAIEVWELQGGAGSYEFDYVVYGQRKGYENYQVYLYKDPDEAMLTASFEIEDGKLGLEDFPTVPRGVEPAEQP